VLDRNCCQGRCRSKFGTCCDWINRQASNNNQSPIINPTTNMNIQIAFQPDGTANCLWTDAMSIHEPGRLEITRASHIEFNNTTQRWEVKDRRGMVRFIARSRSACLEWEQRNLQVG